MKKKFYSMPMGPRRASRCACFRKMNGPLAWKWIRFSAEFLIPSRKRVEMSEKGFLLFEVLLALAILSGGILVMAQPFRSALKAAARGREIYQATLVLEDRLGTHEKSRTMDSEIFVDPVLGSVSLQIETLPAWALQVPLSRATLKWGKEFREDYLEVISPDDRDE